MRCMVELLVTNFELRIHVTLPIDLFLLGDMVSCLYSSLSIIGIQVSECSDAAVCINSIPVATADSCVVYCR
jgi:hypothetical protein